MAKKSSGTSAEGLVAQALANHLGITLEDAAANVFVNANGEARYMPPTGSGGDGSDGSDGDGSDGSGSDGSDGSDGDGSDGEGEVAGLLRQLLAKGDSGKKAAQNASMPEWAKSLQALAGGSAQTDGSPGAGTANTAQGATEIAKMNGPQLRELISREVPKHQTTIAAPKEE